LEQRQKDGEQIMSLLESRIGYKPFKYDWAYHAWKTQQAIHWIPDEVPLAEDVQDWNKKLSDEERNLLTQIFRFFTQADICVCEDAYLDKYIRIFKPTEIRMMLTAFANIETIHIAAYSYLLDTIGMPEVEYKAFMKYQAMKDKYDFMGTFSTDTKEDIALSLAAFGAFQEGLALFASFAMLLNFPRFNKMKGMSQIVTWSIRDETLHCENMIKLFKTFVKENKEIWTDELKAKIYDIAIKTVEHEDAFIDLAFEQGGVEGMTAEDIKLYIRYIADRRLLQLGLKTHFKVKTNPLLWLEEMLNAVEHTNFFEQRATEYSKGATSGTWEEAFEMFDKEE
jgi:ribonucleoside-diphosphate reductase beta chain